MSWWKHFESEVPQLAELGVTQVWLPPPNKGMNKVCSSKCHPKSSSLKLPQKSQGYDAYDLVIRIRRHLSWLFLAEYSITVGLR
jgi:alpha-amylase